jgi:hypothetical protein
VPHFCHSARKQEHLFWHVSANGRDVEPVPTMMPAPFSAPNCSMADQRSSKQAIGVLLALLLVVGVVAGFAWSVAVMVEVANQCLPAVVQSQYAGPAASVEAQVQARFSAFAPNQPYQ